MHKLRNSYIKSAAMILLISTICGCVDNTPEREKLPNDRIFGGSCMIGKKCAMFFPDGLEMSRCPEFPALIKTPKKTGNLLPGWKVRPRFFTDSQGMFCVEVKPGQPVDYYGSGEVLGPLKRNGQNIVLWNTDNYQYKKANGKRLYQSHPWIMGVRKDGSAFGFIACTTWKASMKLTDNIKFSSVGQKYPVIIIERDSPQEILTALAELTGKMKMPPLWALGYQQCRYSYYPDSRVREIADGFLKHNIPCDVIWLDIHYMQGYRIFTFDKKHFPYPSKTNAYLHKLGFKSVWMIDPGVKVDKNYFVYKQGTAGNHWVKTRTGEQYNGKVWPGMCAFPDFTRPQTRKWWAGLYKDFMANGVDGVWNDMNEPAVFETPGGTMPNSNWHRGGGNLSAGPHLKYHNIYGMLMVKASRQGILAANPDKRPFVLTRANFLGGHRYAATWTGDNSATWKDLKLSIPMSLTLGLSGQPFNGPDIGGFAGNTSPKLMARWVGVGAFMPFCRGHATLGSNNKEPWAFNDEVTKSCRCSLNRRYRLLPYLYTLFYKASKTGLPVMRPVFFADPTDQKLRTEQEAFMWGSDLLIVPNLEENNQRVKNLPKGSWQQINLLGEKPSQDINLPVLKIRPGAIIPLGKIIRNTTQASLDPLTLLVSLNSDGKAIGQLYLDKGEGFGYENGEYCFLEFNAEKIGDKVKISVTKKAGNWALPKCKVQIKIVTDKALVKATSNFKQTFEIPIR